MWTVLFSFLKNPKNILIVVIAVLLTAASFWILAQKVKIEKQNTTIESQAKDIAYFAEIQMMLERQIRDYRDNLKDIKKLQKAQQDITTNTASLSENLKTLKSKCVLEGEDAKTINDLVDYFNTGVRVKAQ